MPEATNAEMRERLREIIAWVAEHDFRRAETLDVVVAWLEADAITRQATLKGMTVEDGATVLDANVGGDAYIEVHKITAGRRAQGSATWASRSAGRVRDDVQPPGSQPQSRLALPFGAAPVLRRVPGLRVGPVFAATISTIARVCRTILGLPDPDDADPEPEGYPSQVTIFCDRCGVEDSGDYLVKADDSQATRFGYARAHLRKGGWSCDERGDYCPTCMGGPTVEMGEQR